MAILDVPENIAMVKASREQIEQAKLQSQQARLQAQPTAQQLRFGSSSGLAGLQKRQQIESSIRKYETNVGKSEVEFEKQVAKYEPAQAKPQYLEEAYKEAVAEAKPKMDALKERITTAEQTIERLTKKEGITHDNSSTVQKLQDSINQDQHELGVYESKIGNKVEFVKGWFTGNISTAAAIEGSNLAQRYTQAEINRGELRLPTKPQPVLKEKIVSNVTTKAQIQQGIGRDYNKVPSESIISPKQNPSIIKPQGVYGPAITTKEKYKTLISESGPLKGTWFFLGQEASILYNKMQQQDSKQLYSGGNTPYSGSFNPTVASNLFEKTPKTILYGSYFTPAGPLIATASGAETLIFTQPNLNKQYTQLKSSGVNPILSAGLVYGPPVLELGGGLMGLKVQYKNLQSTTQAKLFETAPTKTIGTRIEGEKGGVDILISQKTTQPTTWFQKNVLRLKPTTYKSVQTQPFYTTERGSTILEGGKIQSYSLQGRKFEVSAGEVSGTSQAQQTIPRLVRTKDGVRTITQLQEMQPVTGNIRLKETLRASGQIEKAPFTLENTFITSGKFQKVQPVQRIRFAGIAKEGEKGVISMVGGEVKGARYNLVDDIFSVRTKPEVFGKIKRLDLTRTRTSFPPVNKPSSIQISDIQQAALDRIKSVSSVKSPVIVDNILKVKAPAPVYQETVAINSMRNLLPKTETAIAFPVASIKLDSFFKQETTTKQRDETKQKDIPNTILDVKIKEEPKEKGKTGLKIAQKPAILERTAIREVQLPKFNQPQLEKQLEKQLQRVQPIMKTTPVINKFLPKKIPPFPLPKLSMNEKMIGISPASQRKIYNVLVRRKGKWNLIGKGLPEGKAMFLGSKETSRTLGRSFKLEEVGRKDTSDISFHLGKMFGPSKRESGVIVQKARYSLSSRTEVGEILSSRKRNIKKQKKFRLF